jgi:hypothetical protein
MVMRVRRVVFHLRSRKGKLLTKEEELKAGVGDGVPVSMVGLWRSNKAIEKRMPAYRGGKKEKITKRTSRLIYSNARFRKEHRIGFHACLALAPWTRRRSGPAQWRWAL